MAFSRIRRRFKKFRAARRTRRLRRRIRRYGSASGYRKSRSARRRNNRRVFVKRARYRFNHTRRGKKRSRRGKAGIIFGLSMPVIIGALVAVWYFFIRNKED